jgi:hypothetical protein
MPGFDIDAARRAGYSDDEILAHLTASRKFDVAGALKSGYSKSDVIDHLSRSPQESEKPRSWLQQLADAPSGFWDSMTQAGEGMIQGAKAVGQTVAHPIETAKGNTGITRLIGDVGAAQDEARLKAEQAFKSGDYATGVRHVLNYLIPFAGPSLDTAGDVAQAGNWGRAVGQTLGTAAQIAGPKALESVGPVVKAAERISNVHPLRADIRVATTRALRPTPSNAGFSQRLPQTLAAIKEANPGFEPAIVEGELNLVPAANVAIAHNEAALGKWIARAKGTTISGEPIVKATAKATQKMLPSERAFANSLIERARNDYGEFSPEALRSRLALLNERLSPFYNKSAAGQSSALADIPDAVVKAQRDAVADTLYRHLDPEHSGAGPRSIQSRTGDLIDLRDAALRRQNAIVAEQSLTPLGELVDPLKRGARAMLPGKATGAGIAYAEGSEGRSIPLLRKAFKAVGQVKPPILPAPGSPFYPIADASRQLGPGPRQMPPIPDDSGALYSGPLSGREPYVKPMPRLGPPSAIPQGGFTSGGYEGTGIQDVVPYRNPATGQVEYLPQWMLGERKSLGSDFGSPAELGTRTAPVVPDLASPTELQNPARSAVAKPRSKLRGKVAAPTASLRTTPEAPETINLQMGQLAEGKRAAVEMPAGTPPPAAYPEGAKVTHDEFGNVYAYKAPLTPGKIRRAARNNELTSVLGSSELGMGAPDKADLQGPPLVVKATSPEGLEAQATATDVPNLPATIAATQDVTPPGGSVTVESPEQTVAARPSGIERAALGRMSLPEQLTAFDSAAPEARREIARSVRNRAFSARNRPWEWTPKARALAQKHFNLWLLPPPDLNSPSSLEGEIA